MGTDGYEDHIVPAYLLADNNFMEPAHNFIFPQMDLGYGFGTVDPSQLSVDPTTRERSPMPVEVVEPLGKRKRGRPKRGGEQTAVVDAPVATPVLAAPAIYSGAAPAQNLQPAYGGSLSRSCRLNSHTTSTF